MNDAVDFVTINPAVAFQKFNVVVMRYNSKEDDHYVYRISEPLPRSAAEFLARSWAAACRLEVR